MNAAATFDRNDASGLEAARLLVVEDERIVARSLGSQLNGMGYEVVGNVASGEEAIRAAEEQRPDLVLMDIRLEGAMDGVDAAAAIRERFLLPIVYLTAYATRDILDRAKVTEPMGYILKPYAERELQVVIETALYRHRVERRRHDRELWFDAALDSIGAGVAAADDQDRVVYMNSPDEALTGWAGKDAVGRPLGEVVRLVHEHTRLPLSFPSGREEEKGTSHAGILLLAADGSEKVIESCVALIDERRGEALGKVVVFRDVTSRIHQEERHRQMKTFEAVGQLAGGVAHAFNNLMTTVLGYNELMMSGMDINDPMLRSAQEIQRAASRTATLTQKLLAFSRKQPLSMGLVDLNVVLAALARTIEHIQTGVKLELVLAPGPMPTRIDREQFEESLATLARNACDAMPNGGRLTIRTSGVELDHTPDHPEVRPGGYILVSVSDTGTGMDRDTIDRLFEPFFTRKAAVGAGLGLAAVYGLIKQCGGDIVVQSAPGRGTTFHLYLPRSEPQR